MHLNYRHANVTRQVRVRYSYVASKATIHVSGIGTVAVISQRRTVVRCVRFTGQRAISQKPNDPCNKTLRLALEYVLSIWSVVRRSRLLGWLDFGSVPSSAAYA